MCGPTDKFRDFFFLVTKFMIFFMHPTDEIHDLFPHNQFANLAFFFSLPYFLLTKFIFPRTTVWQILRFFYHDEFCVLFFCNRLMNFTILFFLRLIHEFHNFFLSFLPHDRLVNLALLPRNRLTKFTIFSPPLIDEFNNFFSPATKKRKG